MSRWIKLDVTTPYKWQLIQASEDCECTVAESVLAFIKVFVWLDEITIDGFVRKATIDQVDMIAGVPGFAASLQRSGWFSFGPDGMTVTNWCEHNGQCAKRRALQAQAMSRLREERRQQGEAVRPCPRPRPRPQM